jgi:hypothetical protein
MAFERLRIGGAWQPPAELSASRGRAAVSDVVQLPHPNQTGALVQPCFGDA